MPVLEQLEEGTAPSQDGAIAWWGSADSWAAGGAGIGGRLPRKLPGSYPEVTLSSTPTAFTTRAMR